MTTIPKAEVIRRLNRIYSQIPSFDCKHCQKCSNPIFWFYPEELNIRSYLKQNHLPYLTYSDEEFKQYKMRCPYLKQDRCIIYPVRPIVCRLQGLIPELYCPNNTAVFLSPNQLGSIVKELNNLIKQTGTIDDWFSTHKHTNITDFSITKILNK